MRFKKDFFIFIFIILGAIYALGSVQALTVDELRAQIEAKKQEKAKLEEENKKLEAQIAETNKEASSLTGTVKSLEATQKKLLSDIKVTQNKISSTELTIKKLGLEITSKQSDIENNNEALAESIRNLDQADSTNLVQSIFSYQSVAELWDYIDALKRFQGSINVKVDQLRELKKDLEGKKSTTEVAKKDLVGLKGELSDRKTIVDENKKAKTVLLAQTKSKEAAYREQLQRNIELGKKFEQELFNFESELSIKLDKSKLPDEESGILRWPLDSILITQRFGATVDAKRLYVSGTHNGVDFRASVGTAVKSVMSGVVKGVGNTDEQSGCYSYGRWILIEHPNGLSSLYSHLSASSVSAGDTVTGGQTIGYSGGQPGMNGSGYSTGPHLHLGLYATQGVTIQKYANSKFCKNVSIPIAASNAYLDPLAYLPAQ